MLVTPVFMGALLEIPARPASLIPAVGTGDAKVAMGVASMGVGGKGAAELPVSPRVVSGFWVVSVEAEDTVLVFAWVSAPVLTGQPWQKRNGQYCR